MHHFHPFGSVKLKEGFFHHVVSDSLTPSPLRGSPPQVRYHEDFEKNKGSFTPTTSDPVTERVKRNTQDFSDISYRGIQRRVVEMERRRALEHDQETITGALATPPPRRCRSSFGVPSS